jgi:hypothetical protein
MYRPIFAALEPGTPPEVGHFFRDAVDLHLHDIRSMLRLPLAEMGIEAGCNFACAHALLGIIAGASVMLYEPFVQGHRGRLFKECVGEFYPWDTEPAHGVRDPKQGAAYLYDAFRNPLAHTMGHMEMAARSISRRPVAGGLTELEIEAIERHVGRPSSSLWEAATLSFQPESRLNLAVEPFYWGVREMLVRLSRDKARMAAADRNLKTP